LAWALAHSRNKADVTLAIRMLQDRDSFFQGQFSPGREYWYTLAVGHYRAGEYLLCRDAVTQALQQSPTCHQSLELRDAAVEAIARGPILCPLPPQLISLLPVTTLGAPKPTIY
jgi:hypothetical protein